jgi:predicted Zn-dependent protease with MMP-like domain
MSSTKEVEELLDRAEQALAEDDLGTAEKKARTAMERMKTLGVEDPELRFDACFILAEVYMDSGFEKETEKYLELCDEIHPNHPDLRFLEGRFRLFKGNFQEAEALFDACDSTEDMAPRLSYHRAMLEEMKGNFDASEALYAEAALQAPDLFFRPYRIAEGDTDALVREAIDSLPAVIRQAIRNYTIELAEIPDPAIDDFPGLGPFVWGYFSGFAADQTNWGGSYFGYGRIRVFKRNIERNARNLEEARKHIRETFLHEIGHALGYDEKGLHELGL